MAEFLAAAAFEVTFTGSGFKVQRFDWGSTIKFDKGLVLRVSLRVLCKVPSRDTFKVHLRVPVRVPLQVS